MDSFYKREKISENLQKNWNKESLNELYYIDSLNGIEEIKTEEKKNYKKVIQELQNSFSEFDLCNIDRKVLENKIQLDVNPAKFKEIVDTSNQYNLSLRNILKSLDVFKNNNSNFPNQNKNSKEKHIPVNILNKESIIKNEPPNEHKIFPIPVEPKDRSKNILVDNVTKFVNGDLSSRDLFRILRLNNSNLESGEIKKYIKLVKNETATRDHKNLMMDGFNYNDSKFPNDSKNSKSDFLEKKKMDHIYLNYKDGKNKLCGKRHTIPNPNFYSHKEIFCWEKNYGVDSSYIDKIKNNFMIDEKPRKIQHNPNGNIMEWDDIQINMKMKICENSKKKRKDPNFSYEPNAIFHKINDLDV